MADIEIGISENIEVSDYILLIPDIISVFSDGLLILTEDSASVKGHITNFNDLIQAGDLFQIVGDDAFYYVSHIDSVRQLTLSGAYKGSSRSNVQYLIPLEYTDHYNLPTLKSTDNNWYSMWNHALRVIDAKIQEVYDWFAACRALHKLDVVTVTESTVVLIGQKKSMADNINITESKTLTYT